MSNAPTLLAEMDHVEIEAALVAWIEARLAEFESERPYGDLKHVPGEVRAILDPKTCDLPQASRLAFILNFVSVWRGAYAKWSASGFSVDVTAEVLSDLYPVRDNAWFGNDETKPGFDGDVVQWAVGADFASVLAFLQYVYGARPTGEEVRDEDRDGLFDLGKDEVFASLDSK